MYDFNEEQNSLTHSDPVKDRYQNLKKTPHQIQQNIFEDAFDAGIFGTLKSSYLFINVPV